MRDTKKIVQGIAFLAVIALLIGLSIASYSGAFEKGVPVMLKVQKAGTQLADRAEVKVRGLIVGKVEKITTTGDGADIMMSIDPDKIGLIPQNVTARLLPKTLFGEKYVSLVPPERPDGVKLAAYDVIGMDRSQTAVEVDKALDDLLPLLQAVKPEQLSTTLSAVSQGLQGRGEQLGKTLVQLNTLVDGLNPSIPTLQDDLQELATFSNNLADAAPDLLSALDDLTVPSQTIVDQAQNLRDVYSSVTGASDDLRAFLDANGGNLIQLTGSLRPTLTTLARYAPEFPCFFQQINTLIPRGKAVFGEGTDHPGIHVTIEVVSPRGKYLPNQDEPKYEDDRGPRCYPEILPPKNFPQYAPDGPFRDGSVPPPPKGDVLKGNPESFGVQTFGTYDPSKDSWGTIGGSSSTTTTGSGAGGLLGGLLGGKTAAPASWKGVDMGLPNSPGEQEMVTTLVAAQQGTTADHVPGWSTLLVGPLYRGTEVTVT
jgi:phospholipid/cholesterol/gamma-HCH transport system substrate-binding protein